MGFQFSWDYLFRHAYNSGGFWWRISDSDIDYFSEKSIGGVSTSLFPFSLFYFFGGKMKKFSVPDNPEIISKLISNGFRIVDQSVEVDEDEIYKIEEILFLKPQVSISEPEIKTENKEAEKKRKKKIL
jgi:hypothetical protein